MNIDTLNAHGGFGSTRSHARLRVGEIQSIVAVLLHAVHALGFFAEVFSLPVASNASLVPAPVSNSSSGDGRNLVPAFESSQSVTASSGVSLSCERQSRAVPCLSWQDPACVI